MGKREMLSCINCELYEPNLAKINAMMLSSWNISHGIESYDGDEIVYCPWCGSKLVEVKI